MWFGSMAMVYNFKVFGLRFEASVLAFRVSNSMVKGLSPIQNILDDDQGNWLRIYFGIDIHGRQEMTSKFFWPVSNPNLIYN